MAKISKGVRLSHISKIYKDPKTGKDFYAVRNADLDIAPGAFVTLLGPSGCGKTTTLRMIAGFESPDEGEIFLGDEPINELTPNKRDTAMVFQSYALFPHYNVFDNVAYGLRLRKLSKAEIEERVHNILNLVEMDGMEARMTNQLSGGQQQRVGVARALAADPPVMLMDEPFSAVDPVVREQLQDEFLRLQAELDKTIVFVTHDIDEAIKLGDQVVVMRVGGTIAQMAAPADLLADPIDDFVADFLGRDRGYRGLAFQAAPELPISVEPTVALGARAEEARRIASGERWLLVVDDAGAPLGWVDPVRLSGTVGRTDLHRGGTVATVGGSLRAALDAALSAPSRRGVLVDDDGRLVGTVLAHDVLTEIERDPGGDDS